MSNHAAPTSTATAVPTVNFLALEAYETAELDAGNLGSLLHAEIPGLAYEAGGETTGTLRRRDGQARPLSIEIFSRFTGADQGVYLTVRSLDADNRLIEAVVNIWHGQDAVARELTRLVEDVRRWVAGAA